MEISFSQFNNILNKNFLFEKKPHVAVGVSGGPDSIALAFLLNKWISKKKGKLIALIVDHQIRRESYIESLLTKNLLNKININNRILRVKTTKATNDKMIQARNNRFEKIINYCTQHKIFHLFLAHHSDDNIETFLLRKIAGSNLEGLNCMQICSLYKSVQVIRPLLCFSKKQILDFNNLNDLQYIKDPSNDNTKYSRVAIRKYLESNNTEIANVMKDFHLVRNNYKKYKKMIFQIFNSINTKINTNNVVFEVNKFLYLDSEIQSKFIDLSIKFLYRDKKNIRYKKINYIINKIIKPRDVILKIENILISKNSQILTIRRNL